jgi:hypothetical protein
MAAKRGPSTRDERRDILDALEVWISEGKTLREFCRQDGMPSWTTVYKWIEADEDAAKRIACARARGEDAIAQECFAIADDASNDWMVENDKKGEAVGWKLNGDHVQRSKQRIWTRLQLLAKWNPKKYGDKITQEVQGADGGPIKVDATVRFVRPSNAD